MKHFYKLLQNLPHGATMVALMQKQEAFQPTDIAGLTQLWVVSNGKIAGMEFPALRGVARGILGAVDGMELRQAVVLRAESKVKFTLPPGIGKDGALFVLGLQALDGAMLLVEDESVALRTGDVWWHSAPGQLINNSEDDVFAMLVEVRI